MAQDLSDLAERQEGNASNINRLRQLEGHLDRAWIDEDTPSTRLRSAKALYGGLDDRNRRQIPMTSKRSGSTGNRCGNIVDLHFAL